MSTQHDMTSEQTFLTDFVKKKTIRVTVRSLCLYENKLLVQKPADNPDNCYAFIGGILELGESLEERIRKEYVEETNARVVSAEYLLVVENRFRYAGGVFHSLEHYFLVELDRYDVATRDPELKQYWLSLNDLRNYNLRPHALRDVIADGSWKDKKHLITPFERQM